MRLRSLLLAGALCALPAVPAGAVTTSTYSGRCYARAYQANEIFGSFREGVMGTAGVVASPKGTPASATVTCWVEIDGIVSTPRYAVSGTTVVAGATPLVYAMDPTSVVRVCTEVDFTSDATPTLRYCRDTTVSAADAFDHGQSVFYLADPHVCAALRAHPGEYGVAHVDADGDLWVNGWVLYQCYDVG